MSEENKAKVGAVELAEFGRNLNDLHDTDLVFEMEDRQGQMKTCSLNDVIASFQTFSNGIIKSFKVRIHMTDHRGFPMHKTIEYKSEASA
jgi:hypothetical protein